MIYPRLLKEGDKVAIVAPAGKLKPNALDNAVKALQEWGLKVELGSNLYGDNGYFSGTDEERLSDLQNAINDKSIAAIICGRGGYGLTRILERVNYTPLLDNPKWIVGFSDITAIQLKLSALGMASIHGPMGVSFNMEGAQDSLNALKELLFGGASKLTSKKSEGKNGQTRGIITGGNLALVADSIGTPNEIDTDNKILMLEEVGEMTYRVDRMLYQLLRAGKLDNLAGLVIGDFSDIEEGDTPFGTTWKEELDKVLESFDYPVAYGFNLGHEAINMPVAAGGEYELKVTSGSATLELITNLD
ncbi:MAG: LD-carboxypeptidase [Bacteroidota bacterium]